MGDCGCGEILLVEIYYIKKEWWKKEEVGITLPP